MTDAISEGASYCNDAQVIAVEHAVKDVLGSHPAKSVAVISPYAGQIAILRERLPEGVEVFAVVHYRRGNILEPEAREQSGWAAMQTRADVEAA